MKADFSERKLNISLYSECEKHKLNNKPAVDVQPVFAVFTAPACFLAFA